MTDISKIITSIENDDEPDKTPDNPDTAGHEPNPDSERIAAPPRFERLGTAQPDDDTLQDFKWMRILTAVSILGWLGITLVLFIFVLKFGENWNTYSSMQWFGIAGLVLTPLALILITYSALRRLSYFSKQARYLEAAAERLSDPDYLIAQKSDTLASHIAIQIDAINAKLNEAVGRISSLDDVLTTQTQSITATNAAASESANSIGQALEKQKDALQLISTSFDQNMDALSSMITAHSADLADATRAAEQKIKEARISVEGATSKINNASDVVRTNTVQAASTLGESHEQIKKLGDIIKQRSDELDDVYRKHTNDLTAMIEHLRDEQQNLGANMEDTLVKMRDLSLSAQSSAESLSDASAAGKETIQALAQSASLADNAVKMRFSEMEEMVRNSTEHAQNIGSMASRRVQDSLEQTRKEIARIESDMTGLQSKLSQSARNTGLDLVPEERRAVDRPISSKRTKLQLQPIVEEDQDDEEPRDKVDLTEHNAIVETGIDPDDLPDDNADLEPETVTSVEEDPFELEIAVPDADDLMAPPVEVGSILDAIRPVDAYDNGKKPKSGFSFRKLFGRQSSDEDASLSIANPNDQQDAQSGSSESEPAISDVLAGLGLSPNVVVDDGCVIEAANVRATQGHEAMSRCVIDRLRSPVKHFATSMATNAELSQHAIVFATWFDRKIEKWAGDREAIRSSLETEHGRAYLLCDAALNYGRV